MPVGHHFKKITLIQALIQAIRLKDHRQLIRPNWPKKTFAGNTPKKSLLKRPRKTFAGNTPITGTVLATTPGERLGAAVAVTVSNNILTKF